MVNKNTFIKERIKQVAKEQGITYKKLFEILGMTDGGFKGNNIERPINSDALVNLYTEFPDLDLNWLITGDKKEEVENHVAEDELVYSSKIKPIPYYDVAFESGFDFLENDQTNVPSNYITHPFFADCQFVVRNSGQSMAKVIKHGDAIGMNHIPQWREFLALGEIYGIVLNDNRRLVKIITKGEDKDSFTLVSKPMQGKKDEFPPQQIKKSFIKEVFKVEAYSGRF